MTPPPRLRLAVDIGGTFVDAIGFDEATGEVWLHKSPTTPQRPSEGVLKAVVGIGRSLDLAASFVHGTTLGHNAILTRRGATVGIVTNDGFRDIFELGRGVVPYSRMYDAQYVPPRGLVPRRRVAGVRGRIDAQGREVEALDEEGVRRSGRYLVDEQGAEALAVVFLNSYLDPTHERQAAAILRSMYPGLPVSVSSEITREYREYERTSTTVLDAYIRPIFERYIEELQAELLGRGFGGTFLIMRSGGGAMAADVAKAAPLLTALSGPAGGIVGASRLSEVLGRANLISFDVGGTTIDACVIQGGVPTEVHLADLDTHPVLIPIFDIRAIGAGGGSIAWMDEGLLRVGPQSAGAEPGPVCYGKGGTQPTVTDAAICLGYLSASEFLSGEMVIDEDAARASVGNDIGGALGLSMEEAAASILRVMIARTVGAIREITIERGLDPREFTLLAFGGAGPMIAPLLMREMEIPEVVVPQGPAAFSALGMLMADLEYGSAKTVVRPLDGPTLADLEADFAELEIEADRMLAGQGVEPARRVLERRLDLRYLGQEHAITLTVERGEPSDTIRARFDEAHLTRHGHNMDDPVQIATLRLRAVGVVDKPDVRFPVPVGDRASAHVGTRRAYDFARGALVDFELFDRPKLGVDEVVDGPAIIREGTSTLVIHSDQVVRVDSQGNLVVAAQAQA